MGFQVELLGYCSLNSGSARKNSLYKHYTNCYIIVNTWVSKPHEYISDTRVWSLLWDGNKEGHWFSYLTRRMNLFNLVDTAKSLYICRLTVSRLRAFDVIWLVQILEIQTYIMYGLVRSLADKNLINCSSNAFANFVSSKLVIPMSFGISSAVISAATVTRKVYKVLVT